MKSLSSEDLMQLGQSQSEKMTEFERIYGVNDLAGDSFECELAKIMSRYANEGRPEKFVPS